MKSSEVRHTLLLEALADTAHDPQAQPVVVQITGGCMTPLARDGDRAEVVAAPLRRGDVVLARLGSAYVCHRVLDEPTGSDGGFVLAGDRTWQLDHHAPDSVIGRVRALLRETPRGTRRLALDRGIWHRLAPFQARLHSLAYRWRARPWGRIVEWCRLLLILLRGQSWRFSSLRRP